MFGGSSHLHEENIRHDFQDTTKSVCSGKMKFLVTILFYCVIYLNEILVLRNLSNNISENTAEENNLIIINLLLYEKKSLNNLVTLIFRMLTSNSYLKKKQRILIKKTNNIGLE